MNPSLYKRPSTLCMPLTVQPDPAALPPATATRKLRRAPHQHESMVNLSPRLHSQSQHVPAARKIHVQHLPVMVSQSAPPAKSLKGYGAVDSDAPRTSIEAKLPPETQQRLDSIFERYDRLFRPDVAPAGDGKLSVFENIDMFDKFENLEKMNKFDIDALSLKPRTPPSLKEKKDALSTEGSKNANLPEMMTAADTLQVEEMTTAMLDELLNELTEHGLNDNACENQKEILLNKHETRKQEEREKLEEEKYQKFLKDQKDASNKEESRDKESPVKDFPQSFTYCDLKMSMNRSKDESAEGELGKDAKRGGANLMEPEHDKQRQEKRPTVGERDAGRSEESGGDRERDGSPARKQESDGDISSKKSVSSTTTNSARSKAKIIPRILVDDAMELHRTKSYVVNLIDTALSNHFGTNIKASKHKKEAKSSTIQMIKKQTSSTSSKTSQKDLAEEIAHALSENFASHSAHSNISKEFSQCSCKTNHEEPLFVKQLRQMRWGHLKHIQQEVRRLEELERFLDSCNMSTFEKCHYH